MAKSKSQSKISKNDSKSSQSLVNDSDLINIGKNEDEVNESDNNRLHRTQTIQKKKKGLSSLQVDEIGKLSRAETQLNMTEADDERQQVEKQISEAN